MGKESIVTTAYVTHPRYAEHNLPGHPEHAGRIQAVWHELERSNLTARMTTITPEPASEELLLTVHTLEYLQTLAWTATQDRMLHLDADTYASPTSYEIARLAAGGVVRAVDAVMRGEAQNALATVRPPGHHAIGPRGMGFCLLGNIAIAARHTQRAYGLKRVLIVDYDVHHGNGTQDMFYGDDSIMFVSTHQFPFYPGSGAVTETGEGKGKGYTVNIALPEGQGDLNYAAVFEQIVWPVAERFQPELILVSAGFDAHWIDPLAGMRLSLKGYAHLTRELCLMAHELCADRIVFVMEGGYNLDALSHGIRNIAHVLLGDDTVSDPLGPDSSSAEPDILPLIERIRAIHSLHDSEEVTTG
ncbi:MAG: histone deacetylase [Burkholderiales bacterium]|nr:histone deacetylase [Anaerolineae bacterium]